MKRQHWCTIFHSRGNRVEEAGCDIGRSDGLELLAETPEQIRVEDGLYGHRAPVTLFVSELPEVPSEVLGDD